MEAHLTNRIKVPAIKRGLLALVLSSFMGISGVIAVSKNIEDRTTSNSDSKMSLERKKIIKSSQNNDLIPMPSGQLDIALTKVESTRDPFQDAPVTESSNINLLRSAIEFNGIARSGETSVAIIKTKEGQKFYKVGDKLANGFVIKEISKTDLTTDITNGIKSYRLSMERFRVK